MAFDAPFNIMCFGVSLEWLVARVGHPTRATLFHFNRLVCRLAVKLNNLVIAKQILKTLAQS